jgi:omega-amidase
MKVFLTQPSAHSDDLRQNFQRIRHLADNSSSGFSSEDVLVLPELVGGESERREYETAISGLARHLGCYVVGGSHHEQRHRGRVNAGSVAAPSGAVISRYEKLRPYGIESKLGVVPGKLTGQFDVGDCRVLVLICADFWYSEVFLSRLKPRADLVLVPTFSVSSRTSPLAARSLWRSMAVSRAYEFGTYVGISDWAYPSEYHALRSSSVAGLADPRPLHHDGFFSKIGRNSIQSFAIDIPRLRDLRRHRSDHAFLSDETLTGGFANGSRRFSSRVRGESDTRRVGRAKLT